MELQRLALQSSFKHSRGPATPLNRRCFSTERRQQPDPLSLRPTHERVRCSHTRSNLLQPQGFRDFQVRLVLAVHLRTWWCLELAQRFPELLCSSLLLRFVQVERCWAAFLRPEPPVPLFRAHFGRCRCCFAASICWQKCQIRFCAPPHGTSKAGRGRNCFPCCAASTKRSGAHSRGKGELSEGLQHDRGTQECLSLRSPCNKLQCFKALSHRA